MTPLPNEKQVALLEKMADRGGMEIAGRSFGQLTTAKWLVKRGWAAVENREKCKRFYTITEAGRQLLNHSSEK